MVEQEQMEVEQQVEQEIHHQYHHHKETMVVVHQALVTKQEVVVVEQLLLVQMEHKIQVQEVEEELEVMVVQVLGCQMLLELQDKIVDLIIFFQVVEQVDQIFIVVVDHQQEEVQVD